jgi:uncharacterized protein (AIM24 family)
MVLSGHGVAALAAYGGTFRMVLNKGEKYIVASKYALFQMHAFTK